MTGGPTAPVPTSPAAPTSPAVSVALATHNGAAYIGEQIRSILQQSTPVAELVVSDDASTDETPRLVETLIEQQRRAGGPAPALTLLRNAAPLGITANFEQALAHCKHPLVALSDQDDVWHPDRIRIQTARFAADPQLLMITTNARSVGADGQPLGYDHFTALEVSRAEREAFASGQPLKALLRRNLATGATMMIRQSLIQRARPFPAAWLHDEWLAMIAAVSGRIAMLDDCLIDYRQHGANQVGMLQLTLGDKIGRFLEPRTERNRRLRDRARALAERLDEMPEVGADIRRLAHEKAAFEMQRFALPANRLARLPGIARQVLNGNYERYGTGLRDAVRNLIQPV